MEKICYKKSNNALKKFCDVVSVLRLSALFSLVLRRMKMKHKISLDTF